MNGAWNRGRLGDVCRVIPGYAFKSSDWQENGVPVVKIKNIRGDNTVDLSEVDCIPESLLTPKLQKFVLKDGDILVAMTGATAGKVGKVRTSQPILLNQRVAKISPVEAYHEFIWAVVSSDEYQKTFFHLADGAAQPNMSGGQIEAVEIPLPPLPVQRRIADILSAYDKLIENSQRRIQILEAMARALYREWFVHFRFPGHENHPRIASPLGDIPKGWEVKAMNDVVEDIVDYRGKTPAKLGGEWSEEGILALSALNVKGGRLVNLDKSRRVDEELYARWMKNPLRQGDILMTSEAPLGELFFLCKHERYCLSQRLFSIRANRKVIAPIILYLDLESEQTQHELQSRASGATVSGIRQSELRNVPIIVPPLKVQQRAEPVLQRFAEQIYTLAAQIQNLRRTRDLLLPRLLSGQVILEEN